MPNVKWNKDFRTNEVLRTQGKFYELCRSQLSTRFGFKQTILTPSCTAALEIIALTLDLKPGDEVILPSYTFVSTANAFALRGVTLVFADCLSYHPTVNISEMERLINSKTKAIVVVHYGGFAIDYRKLTELKRKYSIPVIEDAAHCIGSKDGGKSIGTVGDFSTFSFHETKNISSGMGGALVVNNKKYWPKANTVSQCGTNKLEFIKQKVKAYSWQTLGSNYLLAEPLCAILNESLKSITKITRFRQSKAKRYSKLLTPLVKLGKIEISPFSEEGNGHIFYVLVKNQATRDLLIQYLKKADIETTFHYSALHQSDFFKSTKKISLPNTERFASCLVRLPLYYGITNKQQDLVVKKIYAFFK